MNNHSIALLFPGQGSQFIGMGRALHDAYQEAKDVFQLLDDTLNQHLTRMIFTGDIAELTITSNAQPAIMAVSMAVMAVLEKQGKFTTEHCIAAGHSVGEYSALTAANSLVLHDTISLLRIRGNAMQNAVGYNTGGMVALLGTEIETANKLISVVLQHVQSSSINGNEAICQIANDNGAGQVVLSGHMNAIDYAITIAKDFGIKKAIKLGVSAPFHSTLMEPAAQIMATALAQTMINAPTIPLIANYDCTLYNDNVNTTRTLLTKQIIGMVRWRETMEMLINQYKVDTYVEIGPQQVLTNIVKRVAPNAAVFSLHTPESINCFLQR